jgi:carbon storage regulator
MLVLTRRAGESVVIGSDVVVTIVEVRGDVVRVGIDAPREVQVHREEVFRAVREANLAAAASPASPAALDALRQGLTGRRPEGEQPPA